MTVTADAAEGAVKDPPLSWRGRLIIAGVFFGIVCMVLAFWGNMNSDAKKAPLVAKYTRQASLPDYLRAMGFDPAKPVQMTFGKPVVVTTKSSTSSGWEILGTGHNSTTSNLGGQADYPVTMTFRGTTYRLLVPSTMVQTRTDIKGAMLVLSDDPDADTTSTPSVDCSTPFWSPWERNRTTCTIIKAPFLDPYALDSIENQGALSIIQQ